MANISSANGVIIIRGSNEQTVNLVLDILSEAKNFTYGFEVNMKGRVLENCVFESDFNGWGKWSFRNLLDSVVSESFMAYLKKSKDPLKDIQTLKDNFWSITFNYVDEEKGHKLLQGAKINISHKLCTYDFMDGTLELKVLELTDYEWNWANLLDFEVYGSLDDIFEDEFDFCDLNQETIDRFKEVLKHEYEPLIEYFGSKEKIFEECEIFKELYLKAFSPKKEKSAHEKMIDKLKEEGIDPSKFAFTVCSVNITNTDTSKTYTYNDKQEKSMMNLLRCLNAKYYDPQKGKWFTGLYGTLRLMDLDTKIQTFFNISKEMKELYKEETLKVGLDLFDEWLGEMYEKGFNNEHFKRKEVTKLKDLFSCSCKNQAFKIISDEYWNIHYNKSYKIEKFKSFSFFDKWKKYYVPCYKKGNKVSNFSEYYRGIMSLELCTWLFTRHPDWMKERAESEFDELDKSNTKELYKLEGLIQKWLKPEYKNS